MKDSKEKNLTLIDVFPIGKGTNLTTLSYYTTDKVSNGDIVKVPLRSKEVLALIWRVRPIEDAKSQIKSARFKIKRADNINPKKILLPAFVAASEEIAEYFLTTPGSTISALSPTDTLRDAYEMKTPVCSLPLVKSNLKSEEFVIQADDQERFSHYKSVIREEFARNNSVYVCVPTIEDAKKVQKKLIKGIEKYTFVLHSKLSKKEKNETWSKTVCEKHPVLIIATPTFLSMPRGDIKTYIIENESSKSYKMFSRPYLDMRTAAKLIAKHIGARVIYGDVLLRIETIWKQKNGRLIELNPLKFRSLSTAEEIIISPKKKKIDEKAKVIKKEDLEKTKEPFKAILPETLALIEYGRERNERTLILTTRKGFSPTTVCQDCNKTVTCSDCTSPVALHKKGSKGFFMCHRCGTRRDADITCEVCGSWRLTMLGIGTERIVEEIQEAFPEKENQKAVKVLRLDGETASTPKRAEKIIQEFYDSPGSVLVGTVMALHYLNEPIEHIAVASLDSLFSFPDFRIHERILHIILDIRSRALNNIVIQTRNTDKHIFEYGLSGSMLDFYKEDIADRKALFYPPFSTLIKLTLTGRKPEIVKQMTVIQKMVGEEIIDIFPAFVSSKGGKTSMHALIRVKYENWPHNSLAEKLKSLPSWVTINVEPESIL
jgi:primosomal protein N'